jgi:hypothetical protein
MQTYKLFLKHFKDIIWFNIKWTILTLLFVASVIIEIELLLNWFSLETSIFISGFITIFILTAIVAWKFTKLDIKYAKK